MHFDIGKLIESLKKDRFDSTNPRIPDGVADLSDCITPLQALTREGRALKSDMPYSRAEMTARLIGAYLNGDSDIDDHMKAVVGLVTLVICILETVREIKPDLTPEEILMGAANCDWLRQLAREFANVEYTLDESGGMNLNLAALPIFAEAVPLDRRALDGFVRRWMTPHLESIFDPAAAGLGDDSGDESETGDVNRPASYKFELIDESELGELFADPLEGFDEMQDHFDRTDYQRYMNGESLDEILRDDPSEPDYRIGDS